MPSTPALSVVMPVADVAFWVGDAIESVLAQQVELELIVAIDRSTDGTAEEVRRIAERDPRVQVFETGGAGGGEARNLAVERTRGRYLSFVDGDDLVPSGAYAAMLAQLERSGSPMVVGDHISFRPTQSRRRGESLPVYQRVRTGIRLADEPRFLRDRTSWNRLVSREAWNGLGVRFSNTRRANDIAAMVRLYCALPFDVIQRPVYYYRSRVGSGSMTSQRDGRAEFADYVAEETKCADLFDDYGDPGVLQLYSEYLLGLDIPHHLIPRLIAIQRSGEAADPAELAATRALVQRLLPHARPLDRGSRFVPLALALEGRTGSAQIVASALERAGVLADPARLAGLARELVATPAIRPADRQAAARAVLDHQISLLVERRAEIDPGTAGEALAGLRQLAREAVPASGLDTRSRALLSSRPADARARLDAAAAARKGESPPAARLAHAVRRRARWLLGGA